MRGKNRPISERARAVGVALVTSGAEAARQTGIPERTIQQWVASPEFAALRATPREDVGDAMWVAVQEAVHALRDGIVNPKAYLRDKVAAFEALVEKRALLMGEATSRTESRDLTKVFDDHELSTLRDFIDGLDGPAGIGLQGEASGAQDAVGSEVRQPATEDVL